MVLYTRLQYRKYHFFELGGGGKSGISLLAPPVSPRRLEPPPPLSKFDELDIDEDAFPGMLMENVWPSLRE